MEPLAMEPPGTDTSGDEPGEPPPRHAPWAGDLPGPWWLPWATLVAAATLLGVVDAAQVQFDRALRGEPITWGHALIHGLPRWYAWALLVPLVLRVARRLQASGRPTPVVVLLHAGAAVALTFVQVALFATVSNFLHSGPDPWAHLRPAFQKYMALTYFSGLVTYAFVVGLWYAGWLRGRYRDRERTAARLDLQASELKALLAEARLRHLQAQLQPHFLFNALHALSGLVLRGETRNAVRMTSRLSDLLRRSLRAAEAAEIPLEEELHLVEDYLAIQALRFDERLRTAWSVEEGLGRALVPTLILQPLVENAVVHGIEGSPGGGSVEVRASRRDGRLVLEVLDDGPGPDAGGRVRPDGAGVGLANSRARLASLHGDDARLELEAREGGGTRVRILLPYREADVPGGGPTEAGASTAPAGGGAP